MLVYRNHSDIVLLSENKTIVYHIIHRDPVIRYLPTHQELVKTPQKWSTLPLSILPHLQYTEIKKTTTGTGIFATCDIPKNRVVLRIHPMNPWYTKDHVGKRCAVCLVSLSWSSTKHKKPPGFDHQWKCRDCGESYCYIHHHTGHIRDFTTPNLPRKFKKSTCKNYAGISTLGVMWSAPFNHSCANNNIMDTQCVENHGLLIYKTTCDVKKGQELTRSYVDDNTLKLDVLERRKKILDQWGFNCICLQCINEQ